MKEYVNKRKKQFFDFSKTKTTDTLHKYSEKELKSKQELIETVNKEAGTIALSSHYLRTSMERYFTVIYTC